MKKKTVMYLWFIIIIFILILIPYIQNAGAGPSASGIFFFMGYYKHISSIYLYIISMGMIEGVLITLFVQSLLRDMQEGEPEKFDFNNQ